MAGETTVGGAVVWNFDANTAELNAQLDASQAKLAVFRSELAITEKQGAASFTGLSGVSTKLSTDLEKTKGELGATGAAVSTLGADSRIAGAEAAEAGGGFAVLTDTLKETVLPLLALFVGFKAVEEIFKTVTEETNLYNSSQAQIENTLKSTNNAIGFTVAQLDDMAESTAKGTTVTKAANLAAENTLLNYKAIGHDIFPQATAQIDNLATAMANIRGRAIPSLQDTAQASKLLGKALQDPATGTAALQRVGIKFSAAQVDVIKNLQATSGVAAAQQQVMDDLSAVVGGKAVAAASTYQGKINELQKTVFEFGAEYIKGLQDAFLTLGHYIGVAVVDITSFKPALIGLEGALIALATFGLGGVIIALGTIIGELIAAGLAATILGAPIYLIIAVVALLGAGIALLINHFGGLQHIMADIRPVLADVGSIIKIIGAALVGADPTVNANPKFMAFAQVMGTVQIASLILQDAFKGIVVAFQEVGNVVTSYILPIFKTFGKYIGGELVGIFKDIGSIIAQTFTALQPILDAVFGFIEAHKTVFVDLAKVVGIMVAAFTFGPAVIAVGALVVGLKVLQITLDFVKDHFNLFKIGFLIVAAPFIAPILLIIAAFKLIPIALRAVGDVFSAVFGFIGGVISAAFHAIDTVWKSVLAPVFDAMKKVLTDILSVYVKIWAFIAVVVIGTLIIIGTFIFNIMQTIWGYIVTAWNLIYGVISTVIGFITNIIVTAWNFYYGIISGVLSAIWNVITSVWNAVYGFIVTIVTAVWSFIVGVWNAVFGFISTVVDAIWQRISTGFQNIYNFIAGIVGGIWNVVTSAFNSVVSFVTGIGGKIVHAIGDFGSLLYDKGRDLIQGLLDGMGSLLKTVAKFMVDKLPGALQGPFKKALGISSPSKVFAEYGANITQGLANGIQATGKYAVSAAKSLGDQVAGVHSSVSLQGASGIGLTDAGPGVDDSQIQSAGSSITNHIGEINVSSEVDAQAMINKLTRNDYLLDKGITPAGAI